MQNHTSESMLTLPGDSGKEYSSKSKNKIGKQKRIKFDIYNPKNMRINGFDNLIKRINDMFDKLNKCTPTNELKPLSKRKITEIMLKLKLMMDNPYRKDEIFLQKNNYKNQSTRKKYYLVIDYFDKKKKIYYLRFYAQYFIECRDFRMLSNEFCCKFSYDLFKKYPQIAKPEIEIIYKENGTAI